MAGFQDDNSKELVRQAADIADVVSSYLPLKRKGKLFKALCPFHKEKTPSFTVNPELQIFKCFGCGKGGDVFSFIQDVEKVSFREALEMLAERYNVPLKRYSGGANSSAPSKAEIHRTNRWATGVYRRMLLSDKGEVARKYLEKRSISEETARTYGLGYAPDQWDYLVEAARKDGISTESLLAAGLVLERNNADGFYDRFRNRLIFPIVDPRGNVAAFGGRTLDKAQVKYINSPETRAFTKSKMLYGLHVARETAPAEGFIAVVEGYTDVLMAHQFGVSNVVATLGTALTTDHLALLGRFSPQVVLVFDGDEAGRRAAERAVDSFLANATEVRVALLESDLDPCDLILNEGAEVFRGVLRKAIGALAFKVETVLARHDTGTASGASRAVDEIADLLATIVDPVRRTLFGREAAERMKVPESALMESVARRKRFRGVPAEDAPAEGPRVDGLNQAQRDVLRAMLLDDELLRLVLENGLGAEDFSDADLKAVFQLAVSEKGDVNAVLTKLESESAKSLVAELLAVPVEKDRAAADMDDGLQCIARRRGERETSRVAWRVKDASASGDEDREREALAELHKKLSRPRTPESKNG